MSHVDDIFGDSESEGDVGNEPPKVSATPQSAGNKLDDDFNIFESDSEEETAKRKVLGKSRQKRSKASSKSSNNNNIVESDDDDDNNHVRSSSKKRLREKSSRRAKKRKDSDGKRKKLLKMKDGKNTQSDSASGDEYDSGEEIKESQEDRDFIANDDDNIDIMDEYNNEDQNFDDERPIKSAKSSKSKRVSTNDTTGNENATKSKGEKALLDQILGDYKGKKPRDLTDGDKEKIIDNLKLKMEAAVKNDEKDFIAKRPALNKFNMIPVVEQALAMRSLQEKLLDKNILENLVSWIEAKKDEQRSLPSLAVRTSVYKMILRLPVSTHHLTQNSRIPIGKVIMTLAKHPLETEDNKRILKEITEKWNRIIFGKSDEVSSQSLQSTVESNPLLAKALMEKYSSQAASSSAAIKIDLRKAANKSADDDGHNRARVPISHGYLFTVQPAEKMLISDGRGEAAIAGEKRVQLRKIIGDSKQKNSSGRKDNPRAMTVSVSGTGN